MALPASPPCGRRCLIRIALGAMAASSLLACREDPLSFGGDFFASISPSVVHRYCIRAALLNGTGIEGVIATTDCDKGGNQGYWDAYRVRVTSQATVRFDVTADFDSQLELFRIDDLNDYWGSRVWLAFDDNSGGYLSARLSHDLSPETEYLLIVSGSDALQRGPYTVHSRG